MESERYSIEVFKDHVVVWGWLSGNELIQVINFYQNQGFTEVSIGSENSTVYLVRPT